VVFCGTAEAVPLTGRRSADQRDEGLGDQEAEGLVDLQDEEFVDCGGNLVQEATVSGLSASSRSFPVRRFFPATALAFACGLLVPVLHAQTASPLDAIKTDAELTHAVTMLDKQLFDAYNTCDLETMKSMVDENLEFYHDKTGLAVGRQVFLDAIKNNICGKVQRVLVPGSLKVYPLKDYGAVEMGVHRFMHPWKQDHGEVGEAEFVQLWQYKDGAWKITRVISYDHHGAK
jgi:hypothetical protein